MDAPTPLVSILISTYNRSRLLRRAVGSVLMQDFADFELVIIDDCSTDDTQQVVASINDPRIRYIRNDTNIGAKLGDRAHVQRFVYEIMRGKYFVYLCDDDYWLLPDLLSRQIAAFRQYDNVAIVIGGQFAYFLSTPESYFGHSPDDTLQVTLRNLDRFFDRATKTSKSPHFYFHGGAKSLYPPGCMSSDVYLAEFAKEPAAKNIIVGATLYSRQHFIRAGAMKTAGSKWQAGYEFLMGPGCYGNVVYINEPAIVTEIRASNASFQRTQVEHYLDSIKSVEVAFDAPLNDPLLAERQHFLRETKAETIRNLSLVFLVNGATILREGSLGLCSTENMSKPVRLRHLIPVLLRNRVLPGKAVLRSVSAMELEVLCGGFVRRRWRTIGGRLFRLEAAAKSAGNGRKRVNVALWNFLRAAWHTLPLRVRKVLRPT